MRFPVRAIAVGAYLWTGKDRMMFIFPQSFEIKIFFDNKPLEIQPEEVGADVICLSIVQAQNLLELLPSLLGRLDGFPDWETDGEDDN